MALAQLAQRPAASMVVPEGGECCADAAGSVCPSGKLCVIYDGQQTCCKDLSCKEETSTGTGGSTGGNGSGGGGGGGGGAPAPVPVPAPSYSIPDVTVPSFNPSDYGPLPTPTFPSLPAIPSYAAVSITSVTLPTFTAESSPGAVLKTYSTTLTIYYYTVFVVTTTFIRTESAFVTSSYTSTTTEVTALATDSLDAALIFDTLVLSIDDMPTATVTAPNARDFSQTY
ncbi:MAG: hypothetical protein Q9170_008331, partial [Blastenia crenularia]